MMPGQNSALRDLAHNGLVGMGREQDWHVTAWEHELSAIYDVAHGAGLAVLHPAGCSMYIKIISICSSSLLSM